MILISSSINFFGSVVFVLNEFKAHNLFTCESCTKWGCCRCVPEVFHISFYPAYCLIVWWFFFLWWCVQIHDVKESTDLQTGGF